MKFHIIIPVILLLLINCNDQPIESNTNTIQQKIDSTAIHTEHLVEFFFRNNEKLIEEKIGEIKWINNWSLDTTTNLYVPISDNPIYKKIIPLNSYFKIDFRPYQIKYNTEIEKYSQPLDLKVKQYRYTDHIENDKGEKILEFDTKKLVQVYELMTGDEVTFNSFQNKEGLAKLHTFCYKKDYHNDTQSFIFKFNCDKHFGLWENLISL